MGYLPLGGTRKRGGGIGSGRAGTPALGRIWAASSAADRRSGEARYFRHGLQEKCYVFRRFFHPSTSARQFLSPGVRGPLPASSCGARWASTPSRRRPVNQSDFSREPYAEAALRCKIPRPEPSNLFWADLAWSGR